MRSTVTIVGAAVVGMALLAFAPRVLSRSPEPAPPRPAPPAVSQPPRVVTPGEQSVIGTIDRYDPATRQLIVNLGKTTLAFHVTSDATVRQGSRKLKPDELSAHRGVRVKLRYSESAGRRRADWIVLAPAPRQKR